ncbi:aspartate--tRNA(Asn) ligase [Phytomonospora endophytica]|uniref:Aspartate--tRNA(Asp/Asn) ligase n=1 Tax=Phytomonospora endophytica TaxID=714109 RepID=A0A841FKG4_9ACTN|nr:aspartate--tRNA(Asn) ligase [Phytomonospora endophytica]MBB6032450.1 nondiscriminating aspartyl-tRNA synthetase [Phytomonospora endophytica]GIG66403.1 aspartate--tRNA(Asp/Asn) ligase [Phytomonospora endophytica]
MSIEPIEQTAAVPEASADPPRVLASALAVHIGRTVRVSGWLHRRRILKSVVFAVVRDRSGLAQVVVREPELRARIEALTEETVVEFTGEATANADAPGGVEITGPALRLLGEPAEPAPFDLYRPELRATLPTTLDNAQVALRHPRKRAPFEIAAAAVAGFREALSKREFTEVNSPKLVGTATESGASVFTVDYFGGKAYLAQSPQFYKQTLVGVFERVFEVGPVFRAEPHDTVRHLAEYVSLDAELGFIEGYADVQAVLEAAVGGMLSAVEERAGAALATLGLSLPVMPAKVPELHFTEALAMITEATGEETEGLDDLAPAHERWVGEWAKREHGSDFAYIIGYPMSKRPFYAHPDTARPAYSASFDLLFRGTELVTGGQRLHKYSDYLAALAARGESPEAYEGYLAAFKHGMPPHGGFAIGLERFVAQLTGAANIREVTLFPRDLHRLTP